MQHLTNLHILITRPNPAGEILCEQIRAEGGVATHFPTIAFSGPSDSKLFHASIKNIGEQDWLIFVSPQAVYASVSAIRHAWPHFPPSLSIAAIGAGTAKALLEAGYQSVTPLEGEWHSEGLLEMPAFQSIAGKKIMLIKGEGGRELLQQTLEERGAIVSLLKAYQRVIPNLDVSIPHHLLKSGQLDVIVCLSFESVSNLKTMLGELVWEELQTIPLMVVSERIKELAQGLGFQTIWVALNASQAAIIMAIEEKKEALCQSKKIRANPKNSQLH